MPATANQTLASGTTIASKYGRLGGRVGSSVAHPAGIMALIAGVPGCGKSAFLQTHPDGYIFNLDESSTTAPKPTAARWPDVSEDGRPINDDGSPCFLDWGQVDQKVKVLLDMARKGENRPRTIILDSLTAAIRLLVKWVPSQAVALGIASENKATFKELHGPAAWDAIYTILVDTMVTLHSHGYGVYYVSHVVNAKVPLGDDQFVFRPELTVTDGFYKRIFNVFEMVAVVAKEVVPVQKPDPRFPNTTKTVSVNEEKVVLVTSDAKLNEIIKYRVRIPGKVELPLGQGWAAFETAYLAAAKEGQ